MEAAKIQAARLGAFTAMATREKTVFAEGGPQTIAFAQRLLEFCERFLVWYAFFLAAA